MFRTLPKLRNINNSEIADTAGHLIKQENNCGNDIKFKVFCLYTEIEITSGHLRGLLTAVNEGHC